MQRVGADALRTGLAFLARYRAWVATAIAVALIAWLPAQPGPLDRGGADEVATGLADGSPAADDLLVDADGDGIPDLATKPNSATDVTIKRPGDTNGPNSNSAPKDPRSQKVTGGIGTPEALAAPDCEAATGKIKISFVYRPPCVKPWPAGADNGGNTTMGVTADTIKIVHYAAGETGAATGLGNTAVQVERAVQAFSHFYRLWGRKVSVEIVAPTNRDLNREVEQTNDALTIAGKKPFAVTGVATPVMQRELAKRGIISIGDIVSVDMTLQYAPYVWGAGGAPPDLAIGLNAADYIGRKLAGKPARWAGETGYTVRTRTFGIVHPERWTGIIGPVKEALAKYGVTVAEALSYQSGQAADGPTRATQIIPRLKEASVTSVILFTDALFTQHLVEAASPNSYFPEWVLTGALGHDQAGFAQNYNDVQWRHAFGVAQWPMLAGINDPMRAEAHFYKWYWGNHDQYGPIFASLAYLLFGGIHGAGPHLTPQTFRDGVFALPKAGGAAEGRIMSQQFTFGPGIYPWGDDYTSADDYAEVFWDPTVIGKGQTGQTAGAYRYLNNGKRTLMGKWAPGEPAMFDNTNTVYRFDSYPPSDTPPNFRCTGCPSER